MNYSPELVAAQDVLEKAVMRAILADRYPAESDPHADATQEWADEKVALAARDLVCVIEALPANGRPTGWDVEVPA